MPGESAPRGIDGAAAGVGRGEQILVVEDEPGIRDFLQRGLIDRGFQVRTAENGRAGLVHALRGACQLVVLDLMLPDRSGLEVLEEIHAAKPGLPVIVLTALGETADRIRGLHAGAIDYVVKPFSVAELAARITAQLRALSVAAPTRLRAGELELDLLSREVWVAGVKVHLSGTEFRLLAYFVQNLGQVLTRPQILRAVWGYDHDPGTNALEVYIGYLRRKLRAPGYELPLITLRSVGYRFADA